MVVTSTSWYRFEALLAMKVTFPSYLCVAFMCILMRLVFLDWTTTEC